MLEAEISLPHHVPLLRVGELADRIHARIVDFGEDQIGHGEQGRREPNSKVDHPFCKELPDDMAVCGTDNCQISIQTDEGQDQHAAVQIQSVDHVDCDAQKSPKMPPAGRIHGPKGQSEDKQEVGDGEVQSVLVCHVLRLLLEAHHKHHKSVANDSQDKYNPIHSREEDLWEVIVVRKVTKFIIIKIPRPGVCTVV